jgi:glycosyltransferase involved in cell wall biosynthesis
MDGGSEDNYETVVDKYAGIITCSRSHPDGGQSFAINEGSQIIEGQFITWLNADDYYFPFTLEYVKDIFEHHPDIDVVYGDAIHVDPDGNFLSYFPPARNFSQDELTYNCFICQPACFMRREAFIGVGGVNTNLHYTMDWDLWCRLSKDGYKFLYAKRPLAAVRYYPETKTLSGNYQRLRELYRIEKIYGDRLFKRSWLGSYYYGLTFKKRNYLESLCYYVGKGLYEAKQFLKKRSPNHHYDDLLYGFHRWEPVVKDKCEIHFPWYHERPWRTLHLKLKPSPAVDSYRLAINQIPLKTIISNGNILTVELDDDAPQCACITVENLTDKNWVLESFAVI